MIHHSSQSLSRPVSAFLADHGMCGWLAFDTPPSRDGYTYQLVLACSCGETFEAVVGSIGVDLSEVRALLRRTA